MGSEGFTWSGSLDETDIQSLYAACQSLRFSGKLELRDGATKAEVTFVGGEPIEIDGGDTQRIALWNRGTFRAVQSIPNLAGELTGQREMEGSLAITKASQLWAWVSEYRLTCDIDLERPGSKAIVSFSNGHAESAQVNRNAGVLPRRSRVRLPTRAMARDRSDSSACSHSGISRGIDSFRLP